MFPFLKKNIVLVNGPKATGIYDLNNGVFLRVTLEAGDFIRKIDGSLNYNQFDIEEQSFIDNAIDNGIFSYNTTPERVIQTELNEVLKSTRPVKFAWIELTSRCNQLCLHCFVGDQLNKYDNVNKEKIFEFIDILYSHGTRQIVISGGEPTLHPDFEEIIDYIGKTPIRISLLTNGSHSKIKKYIGCLTRNDVVVKIPLLGWEDSHDKMAGVKGCFKKTLDNIKILKDNLVEVHLGTTVTSINIDDIKKIRKYANEIEVELEVSPIYSIGWAKDNEKELLNTPMSEILNACKEDKKQNTVFQKTNNNRPNKYESKSSDYDAVDLKSYLTDSHECGQKIIAIQANGNVTPCLLLRENQQILGNTNENTLEDILNGKGRYGDKFRKEMKLSNIQGCSECEARFICKAGGCPASSYALKGDVKFKNPLYDKCYYVNKISVVNYA